MDPVVSAPALLAAVVLRLAQRPVHFLEGSQEEKRNDDGAGCGQHQHQQLFHQEVPPPVQLLLERFLAIEANMAAPPIMVRGESRELLSGTLLVAGGEVQIWQGGAWGRWRREVGVLGFNFQDIQAWREKHSRPITFTFEVFFVCDLESIVSA